VTVQETRDCPTCGELFTATRGRRFCSRSCCPSRRQYRYGGSDGDVYHGPRTYEHLATWIWRAAERGSVRAMALLLREVTRSGHSPGAELSIIDELAARRRVDPGKCKA
jgi:hypothetical protein